MLMMQFWKGEDLTNWLLKDQKTLYEAHYGIHLKNDPDYSAALFQANPHHAPFLHAVFPTGEMFQPLARFMLRVCCFLLLGICHAVPNAVLLSTHLFMNHF